MPSRDHVEPRIETGSGVRRSAVVLLASVFGVFLITTAHDSLSLDVWSANYGSWLIATSGQPWLDDTVVPPLDSNPARDVWVVEAQNGHTVIGRSPGTIAAALPAYWLMQPADMTILPGSITAALLSAVAVMLVYLTVRRGARPWVALPAALTFGLATPVWSVAANGMWPHTVSVLGIAGIAWASSCGRWWLVGLFGGIALWGRLHVAVIVAVVGLMVAISRRRPDIVLKVGVPSAAALGLEMAWTRWMYGSWNPTASYDASAFADYATRNRLDVVNHLGFWISPDRGLLVWTPIILVIAPAVIRGWRSLPDWSRAMVWGGLAYTFLQLTLNRFSGGDTFYGYRLGLELLTCLAPAFALATPGMGRWARRLLAPLIGVQLTMITVGAVRDGYYVPTDAVWRRNAFAEAFGTAPVTVVLILFAGIIIAMVAARMCREADAAAHPAAAAGARRS